MKRVFVLGAGFSRAISSYMPTLAELSREVEERLTADNSASVPGAGTAVAKDFEAWLNYLVSAPPWLSDADRLRNHAAFVEVATAIHKVLTAAQLRTTDKPCPKWLEVLVQYWQEKSASVVTLNYDVLVELAWKTVFPGRGPSPQDLYPVSVTPVEARSGPMWGYRPEPEGKGMRLLKLHGSLTWWYSGEGSPPGDPVFDQGVRVSWESFSQQEHPRLYVIDKSPMIVPPTAIKSEYYGNQIIRSLWVQAAEALRDADEIVMMGFSLPPSDLLFRAMLATEVKAGVVIMPVNPREDVANELEQLFEGVPADEEGHVVINRDYIGREGAIEQWVANVAHLEDSP
jgi:hypothetical protein